MNETSDINYEQVIHLIKSILSLEYCLEYQIIPLTIEQGCLSLGMVNSEDKTALDFVRPIVNVLGYSLAIQSIDSYTHQLVLAAYLKQSHNVEQTKANISPRTSSQTIRDSEMTVVGNPFEAPPNSRQNDLDSKATIIGDDNYPENPFSVSQASLEDSQSNIYAPRTSSQTIRDSEMTVVGNPFEAPPNSRQNDLDSKATIIGDDNYPENPFSVSQASLEDSQSNMYAPMEEDEDFSELESEVSAQLFDHLTNPQISKPNQVLDIQAEASYESKESAENLELVDPFLDDDLSPSSVNYCLTHESLNNLTPPELWQELFTNILDGNIDKLCLERNRDRGRILWSQDGILESSLDDVSLSIFQALINEIKTLAKIPLEPLQKTKKVAIEKNYLQERLQLRIDACPGQWGDEMTIQVLRGNELKLHEQKQIKKMTEQALLLAQKLTKTLATMHTYVHSLEIEDLSELKQIQHKVNCQLELLEQLSGKQ